MLWMKFDNFQTAETNSLMIPTMQDIKNDFEFPEPRNFIRKTISFPNDGKAYICDNLLYGKSL